MRTDASYENFPADFNPYAFAKVVYHRIACPQIESFRFISFSFVFDAARLRISACVVPSTATNIA
jgi:hypothetical protein